MTDDNDQGQEPRRPPPPRRKASQKRTSPPPRRGRAQTVAGGSNGGNTDDPIAMLLKQNQELLTRLERVESGGMRTVESEAASKVLAREADPEELTPFVASLRSQTRPTPENFVRDTKLYNFPNRLYAKPDGSVVELSGDPQARGYYADKGFHELDPDQVRQWYGGEKQKVVAVQREKAGLINTLREQVARDPSLKASISIDTEQAWDRMSVQELSAFLDEVMGLPDQHGKPRRKLRPPQRLIDAEDRKARAEIDRLMAGVETTPPPSVVREFEAEQEQAARARRRGRDIEITDKNWNQFR